MLETIIAVEIALLIGYFDKNNIYGDQEQKEMRE